MEVKHSQTVNDGQFSLYENEILVGYIKYEWAKNGNIKATGTYVDEKFRGKEIGEKLMDQLIEFADLNEIKIFPICPYVVHYFEKYTDKNKIVDTSYYQ